MQQRAKQQRGKGMKPEFGSEKGGGLGGGCGR